MASGPTTLQDIVSNYSKANASQNPFGGIMEGVKAGSEMGSSLVQRDLQLRQLGETIRYHSDEIDRQRGQLRINSLKDIVEHGEDPVAAKLLADQHKQMAQKYGWKDDAAVDLLAKSSDARQKIRDGMSSDPRLKSGDPNQIQAWYADANSQLNSLGGDPSKTIKWVEGISNAARQQANITSMNQGRLDVTNQASLNKRVMDAVKWAPSSGDQALLAAYTKNPAIATTQQFQQALMNSEANMASVVQKKANQEAKLRETEAAQKKAATEKTKAETSAIPVKLNQGQQNIDIRKMSANIENQNKIFSEPEKTIKNDLQAIDKLKHLDNIIKPGMNWSEFSLNMEGTLYAVKNSARMSQQELNNLGFDSLRKKIDLASQYASEKREGGPSPALVQQVLDTKKNLLEGVENAAAETFAKQLRSRIKSGQVPEDMARARFEGLFQGRDWSQYYNGGNAKQKPAPQQPNQEPVRKFQSASGAVHAEDEVRDMTAKILSSSAATGEQRKAALDAYKAATGKSYQEGGK